MVVKVWEIHDSCLENNYVFYSFPGKALAEFCWAFHAFHGSFLSRKTSENVPAMHSKSPIVESFQTKRRYFLMFYDLKDASWDFLQNFISESWNSPLASWRLSILLKIWIWLFRTLWKLPLWHPCIYVYYSTACCRRWTWICCTTVTYLKYSFVLNDEISERVGAN